MGDFLKGGKVTLATDTPTAKTFTFCDGASTATSFTDNVKVGEIHGGMMTATTCLDADKGTLQLGTQRKNNPGVYDCIVVWDAAKVDAVATFFVSAINITSVSTIAESAGYADGTNCTISFTGYPNSMTFTAGATVLTYEGLTGTLGTGTPYTHTVSGTTVSVTGLSNVKTVAFKIVANVTTGAAHFKSFTVNWAC